MYFYFALLNYPQIKLVQKPAPTAIKHNKRFKVLTGLTTVAERKSDMHCNKINARLSQIAITVQFITHVQVLIPK